MKEKEPQPELYERVPKELKAYPQWVAWRQKEHRKVPVNPVTLGNAGVHWQNTWGTFAQAVAAAAGEGMGGVGFVLTEEDPYTCVDLDRCVGENGQVSGTARAVLDLLSGWVELSPSGTGLHVWVKSGEAINRRTQGIEVYSHERWMTVTGRSNPQAALSIPERTGQLQELLRRFFAQEVGEFTRPRFLLEEDEALWQRLFQSKHGGFFEALFHGDISVCHNDHSRAVIMLSNQLAILTGGDAARVKRLLYQTSLVREKWEEKRGAITWIEYQIEDALRYVSRRL